MCKQAVEIIHIHLFTLNITNDDDPIKTTVQCRVYSEQCIVYSVQCTVFYRIVYYEHDLT